MTRRSLPTEQVAALARVVADVNRLSHDVARLNDLADVVAAHAKAIAHLTDLAERLHQATGTRSPEGPTDDHSDGSPRTGASAAAAAEDPVPAWLTVSDPEVAIAWLNDLSIWVPAVWQPHLQTKTPGCWPWHPAVVAELLVVRYQWADATTDSAKPDTLATWLDRWRPDAANRVHRHMTGCERTDGWHKDHGREHTYRLACLDELAEWWATTHGTDADQPAPGLRVEQGRR